MRNYSGNEEVNRSDQLHEKLLCNMAMANFIYRKVASTNMRY